MELDRRSFLGNSFLAGLGLYANINNSWASQIINNGIPDVEIELTATKGQTSILSGQPTNVWTYKGKLLRGKSENLTNIEGSYLGPTIRVNKGQRIRIHFKNQLDELSVIHWHGLDVDDKNDGHPRHAINQGETYVYDFEVIDRAGMYWYHPHPHGRTGPQVYQGLAGLFIVNDPEEKELGLPSGDREIPLVIQDRLFDANNQLVYRSSMMGGAYGDRLLINGKNVKTFDLKKGSYRLRLLNGCNARNFSLAWSDGRPLTVIGTDGGLLQKPESVKNIIFGPAERFDIIVDFSNIELGKSLKLMHASTQGEDYPLATFNVVENDYSLFELPEKLSDFEVLKMGQAINSGNPKQFNLVAQSGMVWTINGLSFEMKSAKDYEVMKLNDTEIWEFNNPSMMAHPMHVHGSQFQIINRSGGNTTGTFNLGRKDTTLVLPGEKVQIIKRFGSYKGTFLYHCHNLEHEDRAMMRNYRIV